MAARPQDGGGFAPPSIRPSLAQMPRPIRASDGERDPVTPQTCHRVDTAGRRAA
jgi:hypothetical protein